MQYDLKLIEKLWQKYCYKDKQGYKSNRKQICIDYEEETGVAIPETSVTNYIAKLDREKLYNEKYSKTFNERTDEIISQPQKLLTPEDLIIAMGLDPKTVRMKSSTVNRWWLDRGDIEERIRNGQIKINVEPILFEITEDLIENLMKSIEPIHIDVMPKKSVKNSLLEIPIMDAHFGINTYEDYKSHQEEIYKYISSQEWDKTLFNIGHDLFHNDNLRGTTSSGTVIDKVNMSEAWEHALNFYVPLLEKAIEQSNQVHVIYTKGNHDESLGWAFCKSLEARYPQIEFDNDPYEEHKAFVYHDVFLGYTHGDKTNDNKLAQVFNAKYRLEMAQANRRIIKRGHKHTNKMIDEFGVLLIGLGTGAKTDGWHSDNGYVGNHKAFEIFVYNQNTMKGHLYIDGE